MNAGSTSFYFTGGTLRHDAPSYLERQADHDLLEGLLKGELCYVLTSRQMGKSSLMVRTASKLREQGIHVVVLDLTAIGQNLTAEQWYDGIITRIACQLHLETELELFWEQHRRLGPCQRLFSAIRDVALPSLGQVAGKSRADTTRVDAISSAASDFDSQRSIASARLVIFVDEIDTVRSLPFSTDEFFAAMRECFNRRTQDLELNRLTFCLLGVATPSDLIRDTRTTPFNIGRRVELHDFTEQEAAPLGQGLKPLSGTASESSHPPPEAQSTADARQRAENLLRRILYWTGGHPYLTQRFCHAVVGDACAVNPAGVDRLCHELFLSSRAPERDDNLLFVRERLVRSEADVASLLDLYLKVRNGKHVVDDETSFLVNLLRLSGIVTSQDGSLRERNRIYSTVFDQSWVRAHMPDAELRRQRAAFRHGVFRTTAIAAVIVGAMTLMAGIAMNEAAKARRNLFQSHVSEAQAYFARAQATRKSVVAGQRCESLAALQQARRYYTNEAMLRDEVIACLALVDLKEEKNATDSLPQRNSIEVNFDLGLSASADAGGAITVRDRRAPRAPKHLAGFGWLVEQVRFAPDGIVLVAEYRSGSQSQVTIWDWKRNAPLFALKLTNAVHVAAMDFSLEGQQLAIGLSDGRVNVYSLPAGGLLAELELKLDTGRARVPQVVRFSPCGNLLAESCLDDAHVQIWNLHGLHGPELFAGLFHAGEVSDISWHHRGELLATACSDSYVYLWNTNRTDKPKKLSGHEKGVTAVAFNHRGTLLASMGQDETLRLWVPATERQMSHRVDQLDFQRLQFTAADDHLVAIGRSPTNRATCLGQWEIFGGEYVALEALFEPADELKSIDFSPDGRWLAAVGGERTTIFDADASSGRELAAVRFTNAHAGWFSADSQRLMASTDNGLFHCPLSALGVKSQPRVDCGALRRLTEATNELQFMALTLDRTKAAVVHKDEVLLVPLEPGCLSGARRVSVGALYHRLALHPQGTWMAGRIAESSTLALWNLSEEAKLPHPSLIRSSQYFDFSPDGKWLVCCWASEFNFYRVGDWRNPEFTIPRQPGSDQHAPVAFTRDGSMVALASAQYSIDLLMLPELHQTRPKRIATLESPDHSPLEAMTFNADGRRLAAATLKGTIQLWNLASLWESLAELDLDEGWPNYR
jgi:WD40 repeat protein